jgi:hypothetical protein
MIAVLPRGARVGNSLYPLQLPPVKVGVWCAVSARRIIGPVFFKRTINCKRYVEVILGQFFPELTEGERLYG